MPNIQSTVPVLASLNIDETVSFYRRALGFDALLKQDGYAIVARDGVEIHFWLCSEPNIAQNTSCYVRVADADAMYEELKATYPDLAPPASRPWGMRELYVIDPHGNLLKFGQRL
jgi:catechol 2,3-dioxygenase-like lactoylglutathione lyase family enzyme